jgi:flagellar FliJ protein
MFRFPLQRLLDLKAKHEQALARQLGAARRQADEETEKRDQLAAIRDSAQRELSATIAGAPLAGEILSLSYSVSQLEERLAAADEASRAAQQEADQAQQQLTDAIQERQVLDRLKARREQEHRVEESAREQGAMDAIAITRFNIARSDGAGPHET